MLFITFFCVIFGTKELQVACLLLCFLYLNLHFCFLRNALLCLDLASYSVFHMCMTLCMLFNLVWNMTEYMLWNMFSFFFCSYVLWFSRQGLFCMGTLKHDGFCSWFKFYVLSFFNFFFSVPLNFVPFFKRRSIACFWVNGLLGLCCTMLCVLDINITRNRNDLQHFSWMNHGWYEGNGINNAWCQYHVTLTSFLREEEFMNADFSFIIFLLFHFFSCFVTAVTFL